MLWLAVGYFLTYIPFALLTKALSSGLLPGMDDDVGGLELLPMASVGVLAGAAIYLAGNGWWRYVGLREIGGRLRRVPTRQMVLAGAFMALIIATTILNYTFAGVSILFMILMMRAGTLAMSPLVDVARRRRIRAYSWAAVGLSLIAVAIAVTGVDAYALTLGAILSLLGYLGAYAGRFEIMSRVAKTGDVQIDRRYFAEEQISSAVIMLAAVAALALIGAGSELETLRDGFRPDFVFSQAGGLALLIGLFYSALYVFGTLIYLDPREYSWAVPVNRCTSVLSVLVASYGLAWLFDIEPPVNEVLVATMFVLAAIAALSYPQLRRLASGGPAILPRRTVLFVCGGNTGRSPIAAAIARAELAGLGDVAEGVYATSAGVTVGDPGKPLSPEAREALGKLGIHSHPHGSQPLTRELCERATAIFCMTGEQRESILALAPAAAARTFRLDAAADLAEPEHGSQEAWSRFATRAAELVRARLADLVPPALDPAPAWRR
jgi:protein-tyrosine-phosphatase